MFQHYALSSYALTYALLNEVVAPRVVAALGPARVRALEWRCSVVV